MFGEGDPELERAHVARKRGAGVPHAAAGSHPLDRTGVEHALVAGRFGVADGAVEHDGHRRDP